MYPIVQNEGCFSHHFTVEVKDDTRWLYIDDVCFS